MYNSRKTRYDYSHPQLVVLNAHGELLSTVTMPAFVPVKGMTITTNEGSFDLTDVSIDFSTNEVICYTDDKPLDGM